MLPFSCPFVATKSNEDHHRRSFTPLNLSRTSRPSVDVRWPPQ
jgi:hypothetical protein